MDQLKTGVITVTCLTGGWDVPSLALYLSSNICFATDIKNHREHLKNANAEAGLASDVGQSDARMGCKSGLADGAPAREERSHKHCSG
jgi:hypothetical protein